MPGSLPRHLLPLCCHFVRGSPTCSPASLWSSTLPGDAPKKGGRGLLGKRCKLWEQPGGAGQVRRCLSWSLCAGSQQPSRAPHTLLSVPPRTSFTSPSLLRAWKARWRIISLGSTGRKATWTRHLCGERAQGQSWSCGCPAHVHTHCSQLLCTPRLCSPRLCRQPWHVPPSVLGDFSLACPLREGLPDHSPQKWGWAAVQDCRTHSPYRQGCGARGHVRGRGRGRRAGPRGDREGEGTQRCGCHSLSRDVLGGTCDI